MPNIIWLFLALTSFFFVFLTVIGRLEKRMVWPYGELQPAPQFADPTGYGERKVGEALRAGFALKGWAPDVKGPTYQVNYAMLVSPDRSTLAIIGVGSILKIPLQATWLHTPACDGGSYYSTDNQNGVQNGPPSDWKCQLAFVPTFDKLLEKHREWLQSLGMSPRFLSAGREVEDFRMIREEHFRAMESAGMIRYTDESRTQFHFTLLAAARTAARGYFLGMARALTKGRFPRTI